MADETRRLGRVEVVTAEVHDVPRLPARRRGDIGITLELRVSANCLDCTAIVRFFANIALFVCDILLILHYHSAI